MPRLKKRARPRSKPPSAWARLLGDPRRDWPWPYTQSEIVAIAAKLPDAAAPKATEALIVLARKWLHPVAVESRDMGGKKPDARASIERLKGALKETVEALQDADVIAHLKRCRVVLDEDHDDPECLLPFQDPVLALRFLHEFESNPGFVNLPPAAERRGRKDAPIGTLQLNVENIYNSAWKPKRPTRGWPEFRKLCLRPFAAELPASERALDEQLRAAKRRLIGSKNT
jgi:hypothetical protein